jgi:hypothetical protein
MMRTDLNARKMQTAIGRWGIDERGQVESNFDHRKVKAVTSQPNPAGS